MLSGGPHQAPVQRVSVRLLEERREGSATHAALQVKPAAVARLHPLPAVLPHATIICLCAACHTPAFTCVTRTSGAGGVWPTHHASERDSSVSTLRMSDTHLRLRAAAGGRAPGSPCDGDVGAVPGLLRTLKKRLEGGWGRCQAQLLPECSADRGPSVWAVTMKAEGAGGSVEEGASDKGLRSG